ncbi:hypothetical protein UFOVP629_15 [uncultured Caudovirales phage]|uniref:Uncharacterized protein n=1 Tax=uncultured Caudovirales phage TaxID=2100421 RepID=A0A6J5N654_9CAUD|nr:hypothetical protein UFOVP629_15 [uncultured Caudovirales phage]
MYDGMKLYRGVVSYSAGTSIYVQIPALLGTTVSLPVSTIINTPVVSAGDQVIVAVEDSKVSNVHVISGFGSNINGGSA